MSTLAATLQFLIDGSFIKALDLTSPKESIAISKSQAFANGTGSNQGNEFFSDTRTVTASPETLDLTSGLTNAFGETVVFAKIKAIIVHNKSTASGAILIIKGNAITNAGWISGTTPHHAIPPNGWYIVTSPVDGFTIINTTQDQLTFEPGAATITYDLIIIGNT